MSHNKIRKEKICLNCGTETTGRYCPACGQENIEPKQSVWHLVSHFFSDITHFDGKFFITVKDLLAKPGFLSREYMLGRRVRYLDPIRMYIFTSAIFFLIFFSIFNVQHMGIGGEIQAEIQNDPELQSLLVKAATTADSLKILREYKTLGHSFVKLYPDSAAKGKAGQLEVGKGTFSSIKAYDSAQKTLPASKRDSWLRKRYNIRKIELDERYQKQGNGLFRDLIANFMHNSPKLLFISLPLFALLLKLLYFSRKQFYYVDHGIFSIHLYIFTFLILLAYFGIKELYVDTGWNFLQWVIAAVLIYPFFYYYKAMRRFYGQGSGKTIFKYSLLLILSFFVQLFIFICAALFTVFES